MGCDVHGWIEIRPYKTVDPKFWTSVIKIDNIVGRNYDMFGLLFGVRNYCNFKPIAEGRGMPKYAEHQKKDDEEDNRSYAQIESDDLDVDGHSHTWISQSEIEKINWEAKSESEDERIHLYLLKNGEMKEWGKASMFGELTDEEQKKLSKNKELRKGNKIFRLEKSLYKDAISGDWQVVFDLMKRLAKQHGSGDEVRLVVWFDN